MSPHPRLVAFAIAVLLLARAARADDHRIVDRDGFRAVFPATWRALPEAAASLKGALGDPRVLAGDAIAYGDTARGVVCGVLWVVASAEVATVRPELEAYHGSLRDTLAQQHQKVLVWDVAETAVRMSSRFEAASETASLLGRAVAAVGRDGRLRGWSVQCACTPSAGDKGRVLAQEVVAGFGVSVPDSDLRPLEKKAPR